MPGDLAARATYTEAPEEPVFGAGGKSPPAVRVRDTPNAIRGLIRGVYGTDRQSREGRGRAVRQPRGCASCLFPHPRLEIGARCPTRGTSSGRSGPRGGGGGGG